MIQRARHLAVTWADDGHRLVADGVTGGVYRTSPAVLRVLDLAGEPVDGDQLAERAGVDPALVAGLLEAGLLVSAPAPPAGHWSTFELIIQRMSGGGGTRPGLDPARMPPVRRPPSASRPIPLPVSRRPLSARLAAALRHRRSHREFGAGELPLPELGRFLVEAAGVQRSVPQAGVTFRPHPSAGGRHPLEIAFAALHVDGLERGVYRLDPFERALHEVDVETRRLDGLPAQVGSALDSALPVEPAVLLLVTALFARTMWKYEGIGLALVYKDAGALLQTFYLAARGLGLAGCAIQLRGEASVARWLGLDPVEESLVAAFALGLPA